MIAMQHPDVETLAHAVDEEQFLVVWRPRGWDRLDEAEAFASNEVGRLIRKVDDLTIEELLILGAMRGGAEVARAAKKTKHAEAYMATFGVLAEAPDDEVVVDEKVATPAP